MKTRIITVLSVLLTALTSVFAADKDTVVESKDLEAFTEIKTTENFVGRIFLIQGDKHNVTIKGDREKVAKVEVNVKDGVLTLNNTGIRNKSKKSTDMSLAADIYITMADLRKITTQGVNDITATDRLDLDKLELIQEGVGNSNFKEIRCNALSAHIKGVGNFTGNVQCQKADICLEGVCNGTLDIKCDALDAYLKGVGNLTLKGSAKSAQIRKDGIGHINKKGLKIGI